MNFFVFDDFSPIFLGEEKSCVKFRHFFLVEKNLV